MPTALLALKTRKFSLLPLSFSLPTNVRSEQLPVCLTYCFPFQALTAGPT